MSGSKGGRRRPWYSKLVLLLWKNLLLRKRHWILSLFEVLIPTLLFTLLVAVRVLPDSAFTPKLINETTIFPAASEEYLRSVFCNDSKGFFFSGKCIYNQVSLVGDRKFLWGPPTNFTKALIERVRAELNLFEDDLMEVASNQQLDDKVDSLYIQSNESYGAFYAGIFFHLDDPVQADPPEHLKYDIRLQKYWFTDLIFPYLQIPGPRNFTGGYTYIGSYASGGFSLLQSLVDRHYMAMVTGNESLVDAVELPGPMWSAA